MANTGDQLADTGMIPPVPASLLGSPEEAVIPVTSQGMGSDLDNITSQVNKNLTGLFPKIAQAEKDKATAAKTQALGEAQQMGAYRDQLAEIMKENRPQPVDFAKPPDKPESNPIQQFGSVASMLGIFASAFTKKPILNALNASATAMNAQREGDKEAYDRAYKEWQDQTELAIKRNNMEVKNLDEILELSKTDNAAALAQLKAYGVANSSDAAGVLAELGDWGEIGKYYHSLRTAGTSLTSVKGQIFQEGVQEFFHANGRMPSAKEQAQILAQSEGKQTDTVLSDDDFQKLKDLPEVKSAAEAMHHGFTPTQAMPGLSAKNPIRYAAQRLYAEKYPNEDVAETHINYLMNVRKAQGVGALSGKLDFASNLLDKSLPSMMTAAKKLDLSDSTDINTLYNTARSHFSSKEFSDFRTQLRAVASDYAQFIGRGTGTVHSDEEALRILNENMGDGGLEGFVDAVKTEEGNVREAMKRSESDVTGKKGDAAQEPAKATHRWNPDTNELEDVK